jgi:hypothetical protein
VRWVPRIKLIEFSIGLAVAVLIVWLLFSLFLLTAMANLDLTPGLGARLLVAAASNLGLVLGMTASGFLAGLFLTGGRWTFSIAATFMAAVFRSMIYVVSAEPEPPWRTWPEALVMLAAVGLSVLASAWMFGLAGRLTSRKEEHVDES